MFGQYYSKKILRVTLDPTGGAAPSATLLLDQQNQGSESVTLWAVPMLDAGSPAPTYDMVPVLNGQAVTAQQQLGVNSKLPTVISLAGVFPPNAPQKGVATGVIPGVTITNKAVTPLTIEITVIAKVIGAAA